MYRDHLPGVVKQTLKDPEALQYADREFPPEFIARLKDALARIKEAETPAKTPQPSILSSIELPERKVSNSY